jgi:hypothetical protein
MTWKGAQHCDCKLRHVELQTKGSTPCLTPVTRSLFWLFSNQPGDFGHKNYLTADDTEKVHESSVSNVSAPTAVIQSRSRGSTWVPLDRSTFTPSSGSEENVPLPDQGEQERMRTSESSDRTDRISDMVNNLLSENHITLNSTGLFWQHLKIIKSWINKVKWHALQLWSGSNWRCNPSVPPLTVARMHSFEVVSRIRENQHFINVLYEHSQLPYQRWRRKEHLCRVHQ